jgi:hypothetical protein
VFPLVLVALLAEGRPLFDWGGRGPAIVDRASPGQGVEAAVSSVHAAVDGEELVLRFTFDRPVEAATRLEDGTPVSGRLRAVLYLDADDDRGTGWSPGPTDPRRGADHRLEIGVVSLGRDEEEGLEPGAVVSATLAALARDGRRRTLWRGDEAGAPDRLSVRGRSVELRLAIEGAIDPGARLVLASGSRSIEGRLAR